MLKTVAAAAALFAFAAPAGALTFLEDAQNVTGVRDLDVGGKLYDIDFVDGSCIDVFDGCDEASDFIFGEALVTDILTALQGVWLDGTLIGGMSYALDTKPSLTSGCAATIGGDQQECDILVPYGPATPDANGAGVAPAVLFRNQPPGGGTDFLSSVGIFADVAFGSDRPTGTLAVISPAGGAPGTPGTGEENAVVPLPAAGLLLPAGLGALAATRRRRRAAA